MRVSIHQPNFMPYLGFFDKIQKTDFFVFLDDSSFQKNVFLNRNKILTSQGPHWITLPVHGSVHQMIVDVTISNESDWRRTHLRMIELNYKKAKNFNSVFNALGDLYMSQDWARMVDLNIALVRLMLGFLDIPQDNLLRASEMHIDAHASEKIVGIVKKVGGDVYLHGPGSEKMGEYLDHDLFAREGIRVERQHFTHPVYKQCWGGEFVPNLSALDYIFNI